MNLWGKGTGLFFLSALFVFYSCKDELNKIGTQADQDKFEVHYKEFIVPSATVLFDSVRADNTPTFLVGGYDDELFGKITSTPYISFFPNTSKTLLFLNSIQEIVNNTTLVHEIILDDLIFKTKLDRYHYGYDGEADDNIVLSLHKINSSIVSDDYSFNYTEFDYDPIPLTQLNLEYNTADLDTVSAANESKFQFEVKLPNTYIQEMDEAIQSITLQDQDGYDSTLIQNITEYLFGFVLKSEESRDVIGLSPSNTSMWLYYHHINSEGNKLSDSLSFSFIVSDNFNNIKADRTKADRTLSQIAEITEFDKGYELDGKRYIQAGTGLRAYLEFDEVLTFLSTHDNLIINSTELVFENIITDPIKSPPLSFNFFNVSTNFDRSSLNIRGGSVNTLYTDQGETYSLLYDDENNLYRGIPRRYFQDLYDNEIMSSNLAVNPSNSGYSLNRYAIHGDSIKLKLYYSLPNNQN